MKKFLRTNLYVFVVFLSALLMGLFLPTQIINNASAESSLNNYNFVIKNKSDGEQNTISLSIVSEGLSSQKLSDNLINFDDVFSLITQKIETDGNSLENSLININFDDFVFFQSDSIDLLLGNFVFSGQITSAYEQYVFNINAQSDINILFKDIILSSNSKYITKIENTTTSSTIIIENSSFESTAVNSYAFYFKNQPCNFKFSKENTHSSTFMLNFKIGLNILFDNFQQSTTKIKISIPENLNKTVVINNINPTITQTFQFISESNIYSVEIQVYWESKKLLCSSKYSISHNLNGGITQSPISDSFVYGNEYIFPSSLSKTGNNFSSWFGCVMLDDDIYYFDSAMLDIAYIEDFEIQTLKNTFTKSLQNVSNSHSIMTLFDENDNNNYQTSSKLVNLYITLNQVPTFIAKWEYQISFNTCGGDDLTAVSCSSDITLNTLPVPSKTGHSFDGWFLDESLTIPINLSQIKENTLVFAKWNINSYTISYYKEQGSAAQTTLSFKYGEQISHATLTKKGHHQTGWILENGLPFSETTMPAKNIKLFAVWQKNKYTTYFMSDGNETISPAITEYLDPVTKPNTPTKNGYTFNQWIDSDTNLPFDFSTTPDKTSRVAIATWTANLYKATFMFSDISEEDIAFKSNISLIPTKSGYKFLGWFDYDGNKIDTMPAHDITLYPSWQEKQIITLTQEKQISFVNDENFGYNIQSSLPNFIVEYYISDNWTTSIPQDIGTYDVKITRLEDDNYAAFETTIANGYEILPIEIDLKIAIVIMFALFFIEICFIIIVRWLINQKKSTPTIMSAIILPFAMFETGEFITALIALVCVIVGMIWLIHDLIVLHYTVPEKPITDTKYDARNRISQIEDHSNDIDIEQNVEELLIKNNLIKPSERKNYIKQNTDEN